MSPGSALHRDAVATLHGWHDGDPGQRALRDDYVTHLEAHPDGLSRSCHPGHVTAGALVLSAGHDRVLLTLHAKARRWFHLGGHCEPGDLTLAGAAAREAAEESGIEDLVLDPVPLQLDTHLVAFCGPHREVSHLDVRFLALAPAGVTAAVSEESLDVRWWPVDGLPTDDADLRDLVRRGLHRVAQRASTSS